MVPSGTREKSDAVRVVLVDDQKEVRTVIRRFMERDGRFDIVGEGENGQEGIDLVRAYSPDIVLMDLAMPGTDGMQAIREISSQSPGTKIVVLSSMVPFGDTKDGAEEWGAHAAFDKYTPPKKLIKALITLLGR